MLHSLSPQLDKSFYNSEKLQLEELAFQTAKADTPGKTLVDFAVHSCSP